MRRGGPGPAMGAKGGPGGRRGIGAARRPPAAAGPGGKGGAAGGRLWSDYRAAVVASDKARINWAVRPGAAPGPGDAAAVERILPKFAGALALHMELGQYLDPAPYSGRDVRRSSRDIAGVCREGFRLAAALPLPGEPRKMSLHVLTVLAYACAGERREWIRGYLEANGNAWDAAAPGKAGGNARALAAVYEAVLLMARGGAGDLERAAGILEGASGGECPGPGRGKDAASRELYSLRHLARAAELVCEHMRRGSPEDAGEHADSHVLGALSYYEGSMRVDAPSNRKGSTEVDAIAGALRPVLGTMAADPAGRRGGRPRGPARGSAVAVLPAPARRTGAAVPRIARALESVRGGTAAYVVPTEALAGRVAARLRRDPWALRAGAVVENAGGAPSRPGAGPGGIRADVLVATPEKMLEMLRRPGGKLAGSLALVVADWAHGMGGAGGLGLELLLAEVKDSCPRAGILVMCQSARDARGMAEWLDPRRPRAIVPDLDVRQGERAVGLCGGSVGRRGIQAIFIPVPTGAMTACAEAEFRAGPPGPFALPPGRAGRSGRATAALFASRLDPSASVLALGRDPGQAWEIAEMMLRNLPELEPDAGRALAARLAEGELGAGFPLAKCLGRGIGVYHSGIPDEIGELMVLLTEGGRLRALAATTEIAREIDFPVSAVVPASRRYRGAPMPRGEFWDLAGWAGGIGAAPVGVVGLSSGSRDDAVKWIKYAGAPARRPASALPGMVRGALKEGGGGMDLRRLAEGGGDWAALARYVGRAVGRAAGRDPGRAAEEAGLALRRTYGHGMLRPPEREALEAAVGRYAGRPGGDPRPPGAGGLSPEAGAARALESAGIWRGGLDAKSLFSPAAEKLPALMGAIGSIPEVRRDLEAAAPGRAAAGEEICGTVRDWVSGRGIGEIAAARFGGRGAGEVAACVEAVRGIAGAAARGTAAAMEQWPGGGVEKGAPDLPAMIHYGVDTDEAVVMRRHGVPRGAAPRVGEAFGREAREIRGSSGIMRWLEGLPGASWGPTSGSGVSGADYKRVWRRLAGAAPGDD